MEWVLSRRAKFIALIIVSVLVSGCGLSHTMVKVPLFIVTITVSNKYDGKSIYVVAPDFYGESDAFVALIIGKLDNNSSYYWREINFVEDNRKESTLMKEADI